jgi:uncharacterized membrane protein
MSKIFAVLAVLLIVTGAVLLAVPKPRPEAARESVRIDRVAELWSTTRELAEKVNAPLSIVFGLISLYYTRKTYVDQKSRGGG